MNLFIFLAVIIIRQTYSSTLDANQSCQQLADDLKIEDSTIFDSLQGACQSSNNTSSTDRARKACTIFRAVLDHKPFGVDDLTEYVGPQSPFYINRTESNWYVR